MDFESIASEPAPLRSGNVPVQARALRTRRVLLDTAIECLLEVGYTRTTTSLVIERSGLSRGSLLHQFPNREALLVAAMTHIVQQGMAQLGEVTSSGGGGARSVAAATRMLWATFQMRYFWAATEMWIAARTDPALSPRLRESARSLGVVVDAACSELYGREIAAAELFAATRDLLISSMRGVALTYAFRDSDPGTEPLLGEWIALAEARLTPR